MALRNGASDTAQPEASGTTARRDRSGGQAAERTAWRFRTQGLTVGYDGKPLIKDIEIDLAGGDVLSLIGPNGAGKSTILKSISHHLEPLGGAVTLGGRDIAELSASQLAREMSVVLTDRLHTELLTCKDIVETGRYPYTGRMGMLRDEDRACVRRIMELTSTWDIRDRDFMRISDGQKQRVLLARALCQEPRVIILDEPTSFLDIRYQIGLLDTLRTLAKRNGIAVIMSLHELDMAQKISDYIMCVKGEHIFRFGTPEEIFTPEVIAELYGLDQGSYNPLFGSVELGSASSATDVFVVAGGGTGVNAFRALQKAGVGFAAGVLHANDVDCALARDLANDVVEAPAFEEIPEDAVERACAMVDGCRALLCCIERFGTMNARNAQVVEHARDAGIPVARSVEELLRLL